VAQFKHITKVYDEVGTRPDGTVLVEARDVEHFAERHDDGTVVAADGTEYPNIAAWRAAIDAQQED
jgi:hypothetical protein